MNSSNFFNILLTVFAALGGIDYLLDNKFGLGDGFHRGLKCAGPLILCMTGFMTLTNWFGSILTPALGPFLTKIGADPSLAAGLVLAVDCGGAVLADTMALNAQAAILNGWFVASMFGSGINGNIPLSVMAVPEDRRKPVLLGLAMGIASIPFGSAVGGLIAGITPETIFLNMLPLAVLSAVIVAVMLLFGEKLIGFLKVLSRLNILICVTGLVIAALGELCGIEVLKTRMDFSEIMGIIGRIVLTICGMFPLMNLILRAAEKPLERLAEKRGLRSIDVSGLAMNLVNSFASIDRLPEMSDRGIMLNCAFGICAGYALGDQLAYAAAVRPELSFPLVAAKLTAGILSLVLADLLYRTMKKRNVF